MSNERWQVKAKALQDGWVYRYKDQLPIEGVILGLCPAQLETRCGDAWPGPDGLAGTDDDERNWGACTLRSLSVAEHAILKEKGIKPTIGPNRDIVAKSAMQALAEAGLARPSGTVGGEPYINVPSATIHCDSRTVKDAVTGKPVTIPHFVWFANFATHADGAAYYLHLLGDGARSVLKAKGSSYDLAAAMYRRGYYGGFKPHSKYIAADGTEHDGNAENIAAYQKLIDYWHPQIKAALLGYALTPVAKPVLRHGDKGEPVKLLQKLLNEKEGHPSLLVVDGKFGPLTESAVIQFQRIHKLTIDGIVGPKTWAMLLK